MDKLLRGLHKKMRRAIAILRERKQVIASALEKLSPLQRKVVDLLFGLSDYKTSLTEGEIAKILKVSENTVVQEMGVALQILSRDTRLSSLA